MSCGLTRLLPPPARLLKKATVFQFFDDAIVVEIFRIGATRIYNPRAGFDSYPIRQANPSAS
jgi:hypothetical protein